MSFETLDIDRRTDGLAIITINRPDRLNALNANVLSELRSVSEEFAGNKDLRAVVLTGAGRAFVAGADIAAMNEMSAEEAAEFGDLGHATMDAIEALPMPTIAAVNGFALGGGLELALACDLIYLSDSASVGLPEVGLGIIPGFGGTQRLGRRIGWQQARRLVFTGESISADEARRIGLAVDVFSGEDFFDEVLSVASTIGDKGPIAVRQAKSLMRQGSETTLSEGNKLEIQAFAGIWDSQDRNEGMTAFLDKRSPDFTGS